MRSPVHATGCCGNTGSDATAGEVGVADCSSAGRNLSYVRAVAAPGDRRTEIWRPLAAAREMMPINPMARID
jgi:hypothetical protein